MKNVKNERLTVHILLLVCFYFLKVKFLVSQLVGLIAGLAFRNYLKPCADNTVKRHLVATVLGFFLAFFCFEYQVFHLIIVSMFSYLSLIYFPTQFVHL